MTLLATDFAGIATLIAAITAAVISIVGAFKINKIEVNTNSHLTRQTELLEAARGEVKTLTAVVAKVVPPVPIAEEPPEKRSHHKKPE